MGQKKEFLTFFKKKSIMNVVSLNDVTRIILEF